jgi:hypothetical protein
VMRRNIIWVLVLAVVLGACGVPADDKPQAVDIGDDPYGLLAPSTTVQTVTTLPVVTSTQQVFMVRDDRLMPVNRTVASPATLGLVLASLIQGPTDAETSSGVRTSVGSQASVLSAQVSGGVATIDLNDAFSGLQLHAQILAVAQIVYTATAMPGVTSVRISINGTPSSVPRGDGSAAPDALTRADYALVAPTA